jgi:hypothetical protein
MTTKLLVVIPGFGPPHTSIKLDILTSNLNLLNAASATGVFTSVDVRIFCYSDDAQVKRKLAAIQIPPHVNTDIIYIKGIVGEFLYKHVKPDHDGYDYVMLLLDDIRLQEDVCFRRMLKLMDDFRLDIVSPTLTESSKILFPYMVTQRPTRFELKIVPACEMFCYFMTRDAYKRYHAYLTPENPWLWGMDLLVGNKFGLRVGLLNAMRMHHYFQRTCYDQFPNLDPFKCMHAYLANYGETQQSLAQLPAAYYYIVSSNTTA